MPYPALDIGKRRVKHRHGLVARGGDGVHLGALLAIHRQQIGAERPPPGGLAVLARHFFKGGAKTAKAGVSFQPAKNDGGPEFLERLQQQRLPGFWPLDVLKHLLHIVDRPLRSARRKNKTALVRGLQVFVVPLDGLHGQLTNGDFTAQHREAIFNIPVPPLAFWWNQLFARGRHFASPARAHCKVLPGSAPAEYCPAGFWAKSANMANRSSVGATDGALLSTRVRDGMVSAASGSTRSKS